MTALRWEMLISGVGGALIIFMAGYDAARISSRSAVIGGITGVVVVLSRAIA